MTDSAHTFEILKRVADGIAETFGDACEVVVHDVSNPERSLLFIRGKITGRPIGAPVTNLVLQALRTYGDKAPDLIGYRSFAKDGRELKSSTIFARHPDGRIMGCLCINLDLSSLRSKQEALDSMLSTTDPVQLELEEFTESVPSMVQGMLKSAIDSLGETPSELSKDERVALVRSLEARGFFLVKGAVEELSRLMGISKYSVYHYLGEVRTEIGDNMVLTGGGQGKDMVSKHSANRG